MRRRFPHPEQTSNGVSDKSLMKELDWEEHADGVALHVLNIDQMKHSNAYVSMMMRHIHRQDPPKRKRLRTHETCSPRCILIKLMRFVKPNVPSTPSPQIRSKDKEHGWRQVSTALSFNTESV